MKPIHVDDLEEVDVGAYRSPQVPLFIIQDLSIPTTHLSEPNFPAAVLDPELALPETASGVDMPIAPSEITAIHESSLISPQFPSLMIDDIAAIPVLSPGPEI